MHIIQSTQQLGTEQIFTSKMSQAGNFSKYSKGRVLKARGGKGAKGLQQLFLANERLEAPSF